MNAGPTNVADNVVYFPADALEQAERKNIDRTARVWELIHVLSHRFNVTNWDIRYNPSVQPSQGSVAEVTFIDSELAAVITISRDVPLDDLEITVTHEILHVVTRTLWLQASHLLVHVQDDQGRVHLTEMLDDALEQMIETISRASSNGPRVVVATMDQTDRELWAPFAR